jgi:hypothetical protein
MTTPMCAARSLNSSGPSAFGPRCSPRPDHRAGHEIGRRGVLTKPFGDQALLDAIHQALERDRGARRQADELSALKTRYATLSRREREVMGLVVSGMPNKQTPGGSARAKSPSRFTAAG